MGEGKIRSKRGTKDEDNGSWVIRCWETPGVHNDAKQNKKM